MLWGNFSNLVSTRCIVVELLPTMLWLREAEVYSDFGETTRIHLYIISWNRWLTLIIGTSANCYNRQQSLWYNITGYVGADKTNDCDWFWLRLVPLIHKQLSRTFPTNITSATNQRAPWSENKLSHIIILLTILSIINVLKTSFSKSQRTSLWSDLSSAQARETISLKIFIYFTIDGCSFIKLFCYECVRCEGCQCLRFACFWTCTVVSSPLIIVLP